MLFAENRACLVPQQLAALFKGLPDSQWAHQLCAQVAEPAMDLQATPMPVVLHILGLGGGAACASKPSSDVLAHAALLAAGRASYMTLAR